VSGAKAQETGELPEAGASQGRPEKDAASERAMSRESIFPLVHADLDSRNQLGWQRHAKPLLANDGRDSLREAYEEALDLAVYLRMAIAEREALR
jgi:hypothetical protein